MAGPAVFFVPLAIAGGKVFFKFATKKAAQAFKGRFAKAGSVTTRTPPKSATVTTTGSNKGKAIIKDMTKPVTQPRISPRNPNISTLPKAPAKGSGGAKAAGAAATAASATAVSTATSKDADKPKKKNNANVTARQIQLAKQSAAQGGGSVLSNKKKKSVAASQESAQRSAVRSAASTKATKEARKGPPQRAAKTVAKKVTPPKPKPKMYTAIDVNTGKPKFDAPKVTAAQRLKQEDKFKELKAKRKAFSGKFKSITKGKK